MRRGGMVGVVVLLAALLAGAGVVSRSHPAPTLEGGHRVEVERSPLEFELPPGWQPVVRTQDATADWVVQAAEQQGYTPQEYVDLLRRSTRATWAGPVVNGRTQTVDVQDSEFAELPGTTAVENRLRAMNEEVVGSRVVTTQVGTAVVTRYRVPLGAETITSDVVHVTVSGEVLAITVGAAQEDVVTPVTDQVLASLHAG